MIHPDPKHKRIKLSPKQLAELKRDLYYNRARGLCETCGKYVSLPEGRFDPFVHAHLSHIKSKGSGGDDSPENTKIECPDCHMGKHGPQWSK